MAAGGGEKHGGRVNAAAALEFLAGTAWARGVARCFRGCFGGRVFDRWLGNWLCSCAFQFYLLKHAKTGLAGVLEFSADASLIAHEFGEDVGTGRVTTDGEPKENVLAIFFDDGGVFRVGALFGDGRGEKL